MFHDKLFCHRFFESFGTPHPIAVCEVANGKRREVFLSAQQAPKKLCWKPRYSTMGLGVEKFTTWTGVDKPGWAPSDVPYLVEEFIEATEYEASEWYRCQTVWDWNEKEPKTSYIWRTRN